MYNISYKYKRFLFTLVKLSIVVGAMYFIYDKITQNNQQFFDSLKLLILEKKLLSFSIFFTLFALTFFNWLFEILKWKTLANILSKINFYEATKQSLASLTTSIITPNRIGEYGAKAIFYKKLLRKKIILLNLIGNLNQLMVTIVFGVIGFIFFIQTFNVDLSIIKLRRFAYLFAFLIAIIVGGNRLKQSKYKGFNLNKIIDFTKNIAANIHLKVFFFSLIRYLLFSFQFWYLLHLLGVTVDYKTLMLLIFTMYFIASIVPSFAIFDWAIKGSVAIWIFSFVGIEAKLIFTVTFLMWLLNFALPAIIGSYFVLTLKGSKLDL